VKSSGKLFKAVLAVCLFCVWTSAYAADTNWLVFTNRLVVAFPDEALSSRPILRYEEEIIKNQGVIVDRFGPPSYFEWTRLLSTERYSLHDRFNSWGANAVGHLLGDSARETAVAVLPVEEWRGFGQLLLGSIGNTAEERARTISPAYSETDATSWEQIYSDGVLQYGIRPWRSDPYGYFRVRVGHWGGLENLPLFAFEGRVGYRAFNSGNLEGRLVVPLSRGFQFAGGIATDPMRLRSGEKSPTVMSCRFEYIVDRRRQNKVMYVGAQSSSRETLLATGFIFGW